MTTNVQKRVIWRGDRSYRRSGRWAPWRTDSIGRGTCASGSMSGSWPFHSGSDTLPCMKAMSHLIATALVWMLLLLSACTPSAQLRIAYAREVARCTTNERAIVDRPDTTLSQDETDLAAERARCDAALLSIENGDD